MKKINLMPGCANCLNPVNGLAEEEDGTLS